LPERIVIDHGTEFTSKALDQWAYENHVSLHFITRGRPMENGYIESFHGRFRDECLNEHWFLNLDDAREPSKIGDSITTKCAHTARWAI
jgi:putative transposase